MDKVRCFIIQKKILFAVICILLWTSQLSAESESRYFRSNSLGMPLEAITQYMTDEYQYVLIREEADGKTVDYLYKDNQLLHRAVYEFKGDLIYGRFFSRDTLKRETIEEKDRLIEEIIYEGTEPLIRKYHWKDGNLQYTERINADGSLVKRTYIRTDSGKLLQILQDDTNEKGDDSNGVVSVFQYDQEGAGIQQWHTDADGCIHFMYGDENTDIREKYCRGELVYQYREEETENGLVTTELIPQENYSSRSFYDTDGDIQSRTIHRGRNVTTEEYEYENGMLMEKSIANGTGTLKTVYSYRLSEGGDKRILSRETEYENGSLLKQTSYPSEGVRVIVLYRKGEPVAELLYRGEELLERRSLLGADQ